MRKKFHVVLAIINLGGVVISLPSGPVQITLDGKSAVRLIQDIGADLVVPIHFDSWKHFKEPSTESKRTFEEAGLKDKVIWLEPGGWIISRSFPSPYTMCQKPIALFFILPEIVPEGYYHNAHHTCKAIVGLFISLEGCAFKKNLSL
ncbi:hypothetical protein AG1IA_10101 [Rhizoctonia solani AG-1 IA]|uniref:Beta-lactamase superfamily domain-containing protein n=1 Tax=Thanatephorus cucumeris (strain AG1-IA) TaxID=983506 RepID=L8WHM4_THACA|nr:hypothetical protein AG1IA_10101 [Rhizoctonia solani AG-1 IA]